MTLSNIRNNCIINIRDNCIKIRHYLEVNNKKINNSIFFPLNLFDKVSNTNSLLNSLDSCHSC